MSLIVNRHCLICKRKFLFPDQFLIKKNISCTEFLLKISLQNGVMIIECVSTLKQHFFMFPFFT